MYLYLFKKESGVEEEKKELRQFMKYPIHLIILYIFLILYTTFYIDNFLIELTSKRKTKI